MRGKETTKKGAASFYVVIFTALIMSVVALSFVKLMLSEQSQTSGNDLSASAYDAALAGVEDAKAMLAKCAKNGTCGSLFNGNCVSTTVDEAGDQEYTCLKMSNITDDYRYTIEGDAQKTTMVPLKTGGAGFNTIEISWTSTVKNGSVLSNTDTTSILPVNSAAPQPAMVTAALIDGTNPSTGLDYGGKRTSMLTLYPSTGGNGEVSKATIENSAKLEQANKPATAKCSKSGAVWTCTAKLLVNGYVKSGDYLLLGAPYGGEGADFTVTLKNGDTVVKFQDAQIAVDSTGRTGNYYRRVDSRINMSDVNLYPEYTVQLSGGSGDSGALKKNYWITQNCWRASNGTVTNCSANSGEL